MPLIVWMIRNEALLVDPMKREEMATIELQSKMISTQILFKFRKKDEKESGKALTKA
jgi:hypothetical protein